MSKLFEHRSKEEQEIVEELITALEPFVKAYDFKANEIPDSDLYPEQHKSISVTLGDLERARRILRRIDNP